MKRQRLFLIRVILAGLAAVLLSPALPAPSHAQIHVDITKGTVQPLPIAITNFTGRDGNEAGIGQNIARVISADLERSGLFKPIDPKAFIAVEKSLDTVPQFNNWRVLKAQALTQGSATMESGDRLRVQFRLWDVFGEQQMEGKVYTTVRSNWRRIGHIIADAIYKRLTGEEGYFDTRIVYIAESGPEQRRIKRLAIMDQDGENQHFLTDGRDLVLTPRFSPSRQEITYMSYYGNLPRVYIYNIETGRQEVLGDFPGMTFAPRFSPDGNKVIMSQAKDGNTDIHTMDLRTRTVDKLTSHSSIDTSPYFSPDARRIAFESDRSGTQQVYVMDAAGELNGAPAKRISFGRGRYATPVWSPRGDLIAFTKSLEGKFYIGVMDTEGRGERLLADGFLVESPTWSPNGRVLMFYRETPISPRGGKTVRLFSIDLTGQNEREILTPGDASDPAWSPLIP